MDTDRRLISLCAVVLLVGTSQTTAAHEVRGTGYEPCHLLCSNEAGRVELRSRGKAPDRGLFGLRLESVYVGLQGIYLEDTYRALDEDASAFALELLTSLWWRPTSWLVLSAGMPLEYNRASEVVLPTLHATPGQSSEALEPGGIFASAQFRLPSPEGGSVVPWVGVGYRLSTPIGTSDIAGDVAVNPDKALEGLGVGSDDLYANVEVLFPELIGQWSVSAGVEGKLHMLPRFETHFGSTLAWQVATRRPLSTDWAMTVRASGFVTALHTLDLRQYAALILMPGVEVDLTDNLRLAGALSAEVPGELLNQNTLQTWNAHVALEAAF